MDELTLKRIEEFHPIRREFLKQKYKEANKEIKTEG